MTARELIQYMLMSKDLDKPVLIRYKDKDRLNIDKALMSSKNIVLTVECQVIEKEEVV